MNTGRIHIRSLKLRTRIGVPAEERAEPQGLEADLVIEPRESFAGMGDEIAGTVDYHAVCVELEALAAEGERRLIETLAVEMADHVLANHPARSVRVTLRKFILPQTDWVGVEVERERRRDSM